MIHGFTSPTLTFWIPTMAFCGAWVIWTSYILETNSNHVNSKSHKLHLPPTVCQWHEAQSQWRAEKTGPDNVDRNPPVVGDSTTANSLSCSYWVIEKCEAQKAFQLSNINIEINDSGGEHKYHSYCSQRRNWTHSFVLKLDLVLPQCIQGSVPSSATASPSSCPGQIK